MIATVDVFVIARDAIYTVLSSSEWYKLHLLQYQELRPVTSYGILLIKCLDEGFYDKIPSIRQNKQQNLKRQRNGCRRKHHHTHGHQYG